MIRVTIGGTTTNKEKTQLCVIFSVDKFYQELYAQDAKINR